MEESATIHQRDTMSIPRANKTGLFIMDRDHNQNLKRSKKKSLKVFARAKVVSVKGLYRSLFQNHSGNVNAKAMNLTN
jgi:hypothetical protein